MLKNDTYNYKHNIFCQGIAQTNLSNGGLKKLETKKKIYLKEMPILSTILMMMAAGTNVRPIHYEKMADLNIDIELLPNNDPALYMPTKQIFLSHIWTKTSDG